MATARPEHFRAAVAALLGDEAIDGVLLSFITPFFVDCEGVAREVAALARDAAKPIVAVVMTRKDAWRGTLGILRDAGIPVFDLPESAARALAAMTRAASRRSPEETAPVELPGCDRPAAAAILDEAVARGRSYLPQAAAYRLLAAYGLRTPPAAETSTVDEAVAAAARIGYPVVLKVDREDVVHKSDAGAVALGLVDEAALRAAFDDLSGRFPGADSRFLVARFVDHLGPEVLLGARRAPGVGPVVAFASGGIFVEILEDAAFALAPLSPRRACEVISSTRGAALLAGARGMPAADLDRLAGALCRLGRLAADHPRIAEIDLNPVLALPAGQDPVVLDARIRISTEKE